MEDKKFENYLCRLLSFASAGSSAETSLLLAEKYKNLLNLFEVDEYILKNDGASPSSIVLLKIVSALTSRRITDKYKLGRKYTTEEIEEILCGSFLGEPYETVYMLSFNESKCLISVDFVTSGTVNLSPVLPIQVCNMAIKRGAKSIIIAHNHPRGKATPSSSDILSGDSLRADAENAGIELIANYVVSGFNAVNYLGKKIEYD